MRSLLLICLVATIFVHVSGHAYLKSPVQRTANVADDYKFFYGTVAAPNYGDPASAINNRIQTLKTAVRDTCRPTVTQAQSFGDNGYTAANLGSAEGPYSNLTVGVPFDITWVTSLFHDSAPGITLRVDYNGGTNWTQIATNLAAGTSNGQVGTYSWTPTQASSHAVIQFIWESGADGGAYISCGDVRIAAAASGTGTSTTAPPTSGTTTPPSTAPSSSTGGKNAATIAAPTFTLMMAIIVAAYRMLY